MSMKAWCISSSTKIKI